MWEVIEQIPRRPLLLASSSFVVLCFATWAGVAVLTRLKQQVIELHDDLHLVENATLTLLALIIGFTFSMAVGRYDQRKNLEEAEANAIGTEYARLELMPTEIADKARALLRAYADARISFYRNREPEQQRKTDAEATRMLDQLWGTIAPEAEARPTAVAALVASGMNDVMNSQGYTLAAWRNRLPVEVWMLLILVATCSSFLIGVGAEKLSVTTRAILPVTVSLAFLLIADVEGPRSGWVQVEPTNLDDAAASMRPQ